MDPRPRRPGSALSTAGRLPAQGLRPHSALSTGGQALSWRSTARPALPQRPQSALSTASRSSAPLPPRAVRPSSVVDSESMELERSVRVLFPTVKTGLSRMVGLQNELVSRSLDVSQRCDSPSASFKDLIEDLIEGEVCGPH